MGARTRIDEVARLEGGRLEEVPYPLLLSALAAHRRTVLVEVLRLPVVRKIIFECGVPTECRSNMLHETLGRVLVAQRVLSEELLTKLQGLVNQRGRTLEELLVEEKILSPEELYRILQQALAKKLLDPFSFRDGEFHVSTDVPKVSSTLRIHVPQLVLTGVCRFSPPELIDASASALVGRRLGLVPDPLFPHEELRLTETQQKVVAALSRRQRLDELVVGTGIAPDELTRLVYAFGLLGILAPEDQLPPERRATPPPSVALPRPAAVPAPTPAPAPLQAPVPATPPPSTAVLARPSASAEERNALVQAYLGFRKKDAFDLLEVAEEAREGEIQTAYLAAANRWAPWRHEGRETVEKAEELFFAAARSFAELIDSRRRDELVARRHAVRNDPSERFSTTARMRIRTDLLDPETQFTRARTHLANGKLKDALALLEFVHTCDPQNGVYRAELARTRWLLAPSFPSEPLKELLEALRAEPRCGLAALYAGEIYRVQGNVEQATLFLERAQKLLPGDPRPGDELKQLPKPRR